MKSYEDYKNDCNCGFFNYPNNELSFEVIKNKKDYYVLPKHQVLNNSHLTIIDVETLPLNTYSNQPFVNGDKIDFTLPRNEGYLYYKLLLSFDLKNESDINVANLINACYFIERVSILKNGNEIGNVESPYIWFKNMDHLNPLTLDYGSDLLNIDTTNILNNQSIGINTTKTFLIDLPISLRKTLLPYILIKDLSIRVKFKSGVVLTGNVLNTDLILSNLKLILKCVEVPQYIYREFFKYPHINSYLNKSYIYNRVLSNGITNGTETYIDFDIKNNISSFYVWLSDTNATNTNIFNWYSFNNIYINSPSGLNIIQGRKLLQNDNTQTLFEIFNKDNKFYFYRKIAGSNGNKFWVLDFSSHVDNSDNNHYSGSESFKSGVFRLYFTPLQTINTSVTVNILCFIPSLLKVDVKTGEYTEQYN